MRPARNGRATAARPGAAEPDAVPPVAFDHEALAVRTGERSGVPVVVAVHSTALGPALGGLRIWHYPDPDDGIRDALRLASGMTLKAAAAELDLGGGKGVICAPAGGLEGERRRAALLDFGDLVESLGGGYITAEDVGTAPADLVAISERTGYLTGLPPELGGTGDPSPFTAIGVRGAIRACARERFDAGELAGISVCVVGLGHVGAELARLLALDGCELIVADIDPAKRELAARLGRAGSSPATRPRSAARCSRRARSAERSTTPTSTCSAARSSVARPTTSSPTTRSPRRWTSAGSSTRPTSSPTRAA